MSPTLTGTSQKRQRMTGDERRELILHNARQVFARQSYREASTSALAQASDISEPMLYKHFGSKKGLFLAVLSRYGDHFSIFWQSRLTEVGNAQPLDALVDVGLAYWQAIQDDPDILKVYFQAIAESGDPDIAAAARANLHNAYAFFADLLTKAQANGDIDPQVDIDVATWGYLSMGFAMQTSLMLSPNNALTETTLREMNRLWLRGLCAPQNTP